MRENIATRGVSFPVYSFNGPNLRYTTLLSLSHITRKRYRADGRFLPPWHTPYPLSPGNTPQPRDSSKLRPLSAHFIGIVESEGKFVVPRLHYWAQYTISGRPFHADHQSMNVNGKPQRCYSDGFHRSRYRTCGSSS